MNFLLLTINLFMVFRDKTDAQKESNKQINRQRVCVFSFTVNWFRFFFLFKLLWMLLFALFYLFHASKATCQNDYVCEHDALFGDCCNNSSFCVSIAGVWEYQILTFFLSFNWLLVIKKHSNNALFAIQKPRCVNKKKVEKMWL